MGRQARISHLPVKSGEAPPPLAALRPQGFQQQHPRSSFSPTSDMAASEMSVDSDEESRLESPAAASSSPARFSIERILGLGPKDPSPLPPPPPKVLRPTPSTAASAFDFGQFPGLLVQPSSSSLSYSHAAAYPALLYGGWLTAKHPGQLFGLQGV